MSAPPSPAAAAAAPAPVSVWRMYRAMVGIGVLCGLTIVTVFALTRPVIARNRAAALERAIFQVLPAADTRASFVYVPSGGSRGGDSVPSGGSRGGDSGVEGRFEALEGEGEAGGERSGAPRVHAGYDADGRLVGLALEARGMGYQDTIRVLYGYSFEHQAVVGLRVLESKETPGLGDKIETDAIFQRNFGRLDVSLNAEESAVAHPIVVVKPGQKREPWQIDGITGATISSVAIGDILRGSTARWVPLVRRQMDDFEQPGGGGDG